MAPITHGTSAVGISATRPSNVPGAFIVYSERPKLMYVRYIWGLRLSTFTGPTIVMKNR